MVFSAPIRVPATHVSSFRIGDKVSFGRGLALTGFRLDIGEMSAQLWPQKVLHVQIERLHVENCIAMAFAVAGVIYREFLPEIVQASFCTI